MFETLRLVSRACFFNDLLALLIVLILLALLTRRCAKDKEGELLYRGYSPANNSLPGLPVEFAMIGRAMKRKDAAALELSIDNH